MSSAQELFYNQQQVSFHFWNCQLTEASPRYRWQPENSPSSAVESLELASKRRQGNRKSDSEANENGEEKSEKGAAKVDGKSDNPNGESLEGQKMNGENANGKDANGDDLNGEGYETSENCEATPDADYMQHVLKVNACILGPKAAGVHLIAVRTRCYRQEEPDSCPIVCIDPDSQRTVALGYEFVLDSQNEVVTFELVEGSGPVWLTGLHQVRMHDTDDSAVCDADDGEPDADSIDEEDEADESVDLTEEEEDEEEDEEEEEEVARPVAKRVARASKTDQQKPVASPKKRQPIPANKKNGNKGRAARKT